MEQVKIVDVTLREGDQAPLTSFNASEKAMIALMLTELGVDIIEVGFGASRVDFDNIKKVSEIVGDKNIRISSLGRALESDTIASLEALKGVKKPRIHIFLAMSKEHINGKFRKPGESLEQVRERLIIQAETEIKRANSWAKENNVDLEIEFSPEDATGNALTSPQPSPYKKEEENKKIFDLKNNDDFDFLVKVCEKAIKSGATILNIPDTLGNLLPNESYEFFKELKARLSFLEKDYNFSLSCHIHNDLGLATANAIESARGGARFIESTIYGIGERAGNTNTSDIIGIFETKKDNLLLSLSKNINIPLIGPVSDFVKGILSLSKTLQTPFIGALSDIDGSGVHNAAKDLYGGSKDKKKFGGAILPEFFSPRGGANQIVSMLEKFQVKEDKKSEIIAKTTTVAAKNSQIVKALYDNNIYAIYLKEKGNFEIKNIQIKNNHLDLEINLKGKNINFSGKVEGKNGVIKTFIDLLNKHFGENKVKVKDLKVKAKASLAQEFEKFKKRINYLNINLSDDFYKKAEKILEEVENKDSFSEAKSINHVILEVDGKEIYSNAFDKNVTIGNIKAILEGVIHIL